MLWVNIIILFRNDGVYINQKLVMIIKYFQVKGYIFFEKFLNDFLMFGRLYVGKINIREKRIE